jgi:hypothetical protein
MNRDAFFFLAFLVCSLIALAFVGSSQMGRKRRRASSIAPPLRPAPVASQMAGNRASPSRSTGPAVFLLLLCFAVCQSTAIFVTYNNQTYDYNGTLLLVFRVFCGVWRPSDWVVLNSLRVVCVQPWLWRSWDRPTSISPHPALQRVRTPRASHKTSISQATSWWWAAMVARKKPSNAMCRGQAALESSCSLRYTLFSYRRQYESFCPDRKLFGLCSGFQNPHHRF